MTPSESKDLYPTVRESRELAEKAKKYGITNLPVSRRGGKPVEPALTALVTDRPHRSSRS